MEVKTLISRKDEIGELAYSLDAMTKDLLLRMDSIASFAADVSHELKNPLTSLRSAIETLSIIAYKQPITRLEIEHLRGVDCTGVIKNLLEKEMIIVKGRQEGLGRALLYATSKNFLEKFGLNNLKDLPSVQDMEDIIESEVKK